MTIENKTVLKAHDLIKKRIEALVDKKQGLRDRIDEKWPADCYDLIEGVEREMERRKNRKL